MTCVGGKTKAGHPFRAQFLREPSPEDLEAVEDLAEAAVRYLERKGEPEARELVDRPSKTGLRGSPS